MGTMSRIASGLKRTFCVSSERGGSSPPKAKNSSPNGKKATRDVLGAQPSGRVSLASMSQVRAPSPGAATRPSFQSQSDSVAGGAARVVKTAVVQEAEKRVEDALKKLLEMSRAEAGEVASAFVEQELTGGGFAMAGKNTGADEAKFLWTLCCTIQTINDRPSFELREKLMGLIHHKLKGLPDGFYKDKLSELNAFCNPEAAAVSIPLYQPYVGTLFLDFFDQNKLDEQELRAMIESRCTVNSMALATGKTIDEIEHQLLRSPPLVKHICGGENLKALADKYGVSPQGFETMVAMATSGSHIHETTRRSKFFSSISEAYEEYYSQKTLRGRIRGGALEAILEAKLEAVRKDALASGIPFDKVEQLLRDAKPEESTKADEERSANIYARMYESRVENLKGL